MTNPTGDALVARIKELEAENEALQTANDRYRGVLEIIAGSADRLQAMQARCALGNIGPPV